MFYWHWKKLKYDLWEGKKQIDFGSNLSRHFKSWWTDFNWNLNKEIMKIGTLKYIVVCSRSQNLVVLRPKLLWVLRPYLEYFYYGILWTLSKDGHRVLYYKKKLFKLLISSRKKIIMLDTHNIDTYLVSKLSICCQ
jgi:hypothetical protein